MEIIAGDKNSLPTISFNAKGLVEHGYDQVAPAYLSKFAPRSIPTRAAYIEKLLAKLPPGAKVLELGCGPGVPCTQTFITHGLEVTGVDISSVQIELARQHVPQATLIHADMMALSFPPASFDAVVAFYSIFHLPKEEQGMMIGRVAGWLKEGGWFLCNLHADEGDLVLDDWLSPGVRMFSSGLGVQGNRDMLREDGNGLTIVDDEIAVEKVGRVEARFHWIFAMHRGKGRCIGKRQIE
ncbi:MAG: hypothetical protein Q9187_006430 [Circinaria calcarea]